MAHDGKVPRGDNIYPFGCKTVVTTDASDRSTDKRTAPRGEVGIFLGIDPTHGDGGFQHLIRRRCLPKISTRASFFLDEFPGLKALTENEPAHVVDASSQRGEPTIAQRLSRRRRQAQGAEAKLEWALSGR